MTSWHRHLTMTMLKNHLGKSIVLIAVIIIAFVIIIDVVVAVVVFNLFFCSVRLKDYYEIQHLKWVMEEVVPVLPHHSEGLVFTPLDLPYVPGPNKYL